MAVASVAGRADGIVNSAYGAFTGDGTATTITLGFVPTYVLVVNETDVIMWQKLGNQAAANCLKTVTAGTMTLDATSAVVISGNTLVLSAALAASAKAIKWIARA